MATITIRNLDKKTVDRLKILAKTLGCSMEKLTREILMEKVESKSALLQAIENSWKENKKEISPELIEELISTSRKRAI